MRHDHGSATSSTEPMPSDPSQAELQRWMALTAEGDAAALEALFLATYAPLCVIARSYVRSAADAEDVVEETFLKLWTHRDRLHVRGSVRNYLAVAVRNTALNYLARRRVEAKYTAAPAFHEHLVHSAAGDDVQELLQSQEVAERVRRAIDALPSRARETYCLYYHRRLTYAEIARVMGVSVRTVEAQLARSVRKLTALLEDVLE